MFIDHMYFAISNERSDNNLIEVSLTKKENTQLRIYRTK